MDDALILQNELNNAIDWCTLNRLSLNINKCFHITFHKSYNFIISSYHISNIALKSVKEILDLGVLFDAVLTFISHLNYIIPKAYSLLAFIRRNSSDFKDPYTRKLLYSSFVRSKLEYCSFIWNPIYAIHCNRLERLQKKFLKFALSAIQFSDPLPPYHSRCMLINIQSLETRRMIQAVMFIYDIVCGNIDCPALLELIHFIIPGRLLRHVDLFYIGLHRTNYALNEPIIRTLNLYNKINVNSSVDFSLTKEKFKNLILRIL